MPVLHPAPLAPPIVGDVVRCTVELTTRGNRQENLWDYMSDAFASQAQLLADLNDLVAAWKTAADAAYAPALSSLTTITFIRAQVLSRSDIASTGSPDTTAGSLSAFLEDFMLAAVIRKGSGLKGRHGAGRTYFGPLHQSYRNGATAPNDITPAGLALVNAVATAMLASFTTTGGRTYSPCISSRPVSPSIVVIRAQPVDVIRSGGVTQLATQRRRREGRGI